MEQLSLLDIMEPPPPPPVYVEPTYRTVMTRAYGRDYELKLREETPDPIEIEVRGIQCLISFDFGFCTYTVQPHGSLFWTETGYRSWAGFFTADHNDAERITEAIERFIDGPTKNGNGIGGKLVRWWPMYATQWRQKLGFVLEYGRDRSKLWGQWGEEKHAAIWAEKEAAFEADLRRMEADGIDPNDLGKPRGFKGTWPRFTYDTKLSEFSA